MTEEKTVDNEVDRDSREAGIQEGARSMICDGMEDKSLEGSSKMSGRESWYRAEPRAQWTRDTGILCLLLLTCELGFGNIAVFPGHRMWGCSLSSVEEGCSARLASIEVVGPRPVAHVEGASW